MHSHATSSSSRHDGDDSFIRKADIQAYLRRKIAQLADPNNQFAELDGESTDFPIDVPPVRIVVLKISPL